MFLLILEYIKAVDALYRRWIDDRINFRASEKQLESWVTSAVKRWPPASEKKPKGEKKHFRGLLPERFKGPTKKDELLPKIEGENGDTGVDLPHQIERENGEPGETGVLLPKIEGVRLLSY